jgi:metal-responsive CopG/Arc/MetJ family transcriptional regulator
MNWIHVNIPKDLLEEIKKLVETNKFWVNEHEFIQDALREKIMEIKQKENELSKEVGTE